MRNREQDEAWLMALAKPLTTEAVYITPAHYDGGYDVHVGQIRVFLEYEAIDGNEREEFLRRYQAKL